MIQMSWKPCINARTRSLPFVMRAAIKALKRCHKQPKQGRPQTESFSLEAREASEIDEKVISTLLD